MLSREQANDTDKANGQGDRHHLYTTRCPHDIAHPAKAQPHRCRAGAESAFRHADGLRRSKTDAAAIMGDLTAVGPPITQSIAQSHGGSLVLNEAEGGGLRACLIFPRLMTAIEPVAQGDVS
jgi:hypothetical protein